MSARLELDDLPPRYRAQAEKQLAQRRCGGQSCTCIVGSRCECRQIDRTRV